MAEILERIVARKREEVALAKQTVSVRQLEQGLFFDRKTNSLAALLQQTDQPQIIAEFKRRSPSLGIINDRFQPEEIAKSYASSGAIAMSVLTDVDFFGGSQQDLEAARKAVSIPLLRKDFVIDTYQLLEAKAWGADIVLLIAACLSPKQVKELAAFARSLGLDVLLEVHNRQELEESFCEELSMLGVNNRNLKDFSLSLEHSYELAELIPTSVPKISESGISKTETVQDLFRIGYKGFLMGEQFMKQAHPGIALDKFKQELA